MIADVTALVSDVMTHPAEYVTTETDQEHVVHLFKELDTIAVPVVDGHHRLVGIVTADVALDIQEDEHTEDLYKHVGLDHTKVKEAERSNALIHGSMWQIWKIRLPILLLVLVGGFLAGFIVEGFEEVLDEVVVVAFFIPLIMDMGGSIGGQSTTIFARAFVLNQMKPGQFGKALLKETLVGLSIGSIIGFFGFFAVWAWQGDPMLGLVIALALIANCMMASFFGFVVPWFLTKIGFDQAAGSGPIITSIKDITGLLVYFGLVMLLLSHML
jgi:magnesium transporter